MRRLLSISYTDWAFNIAMLVLRVGAGALLMSYGYQKLIHFSEKKHGFMNFLGMGSTLSLSLLIFAEFFCSLFIIIGLFTRFFAIPVVIAMSVALFKAKHGDFFGAGKDAALFLCAFFAVLMCGPGKASVDGMIGN